MVLTGWTVLFPFPHSSPVPRARPLHHLCQERVPFLTCAKRVPLKGDLGGEGAGLFAADEARLSPKSVVAKEGQDCS